MGLNLGVRHRKKTTLLSSKQGQNPTHPTDKCVTVQAEKAKGASRSGLNKCPRAKTN
jgi:hypothetical protein